MSDATSGVETAHQGDQAFWWRAGEALLLADQAAAEQAGLHDTLGMLAGEAAPMTEAGANEISSITLEIVAMPQPFIPSGAARRSRGRAPS
jgi:hypothetical protein